MALNDWYEAVDFFNDRKMAEVILLKVLMDRVISIPLIIFLIVSLVYSS